MEITNKNKLTFKDYIFDDKNLDAKETVILFLLLDLYNVKKGYSFPSEQTLADKSKYSLRSVKRAIKSLKEKGYIDWEQGNTGKSNHYQIFDKWSENSNAPQQDDEVYCGQDVDFE